MEFTISRNTFLKSLSHAYGIIEKKTTLPILSNVLIEAKDSKIKITATVASTWSFPKRINGSASISFSSFLRWQSFLILY